MDARASVVAIGVMLAALICSVAATWADGADESVELVLTPACGGHGFAGRIAQHGVVVLFEACEVDGVLTSTLDFEDARPIARLEIRDDQIRTWVGGHSTKDVESLTNAEKRRLELIIAGPESNLAISIPERLTGMGFDPNADSVRALNALMMVFNE